nr:hypothetical protein [Tanacetum cinerariifolium]
MPELEDITYSDDEDDVGAEADFTNLETTIRVSPIPTTIVHKDHHVTQLICDLSSATQTRSVTRVAKDQGGLSQINNDDFHTCMFACFLSQEEPKRVHQALKDPSWIEAMQEEPLQFKMNKEEGIDYEEVFAPVLRIEAIRLFLAYASFMGFMVYQMNVKSAFLYGTIKYEVYVYQLPRFEDPDYPDKVYKVVKALYGLHQAFRAWYETWYDDFHTCMFACFLSQEEPKRVHQGLKYLIWIEAMQEELLQFKMQKVWVLVDLPHGKRAIGHTQEEGIDYEEVFAPIARIEAIRLFLAYASFMGFMVYQMDVKSAFLYGTIKEEDLCKSFEKLMKDKFQMSSMGELTFFLGLQVKQKKDGIFISQDKYVAEILRKFRLTEGKSASTPKDTEKPLLKDPDGEDVDVHTYRSMIGSLMYLTSSRPDIMFASSVSVKTVNDVPRLQALVDKKKVIISEAKIRDALHLDDTEDIECLPNEEIFTELARMGCRTFNFSKYIFDSLVRNVDSPTKFYMVGKGCSGVETPLFEGMIVAQQVDAGVAEVNVEVVFAVGVAAEGVAGDADDEVPAAVNAPSRVKKLESKNKAFKLRRLKKVGTAHKIETSDDTIMDDVSKQGRIIADMDADKDVTLKDVAAIAKDVQDVEIEESSDVQGRKAESQAQIYQIDLEHADKVLSMQDVDRANRAQEVVEVVTTAKLITKVVTAASTTITAAVLQLTTAVAPTLTTAPSAARRRTEGKGIMVEELKPLKKQAQIEHDEAYARELEAELKKNIDRDEVIDHVQRKEKEDNVVKRYQALKRKPQTEAQARKNMMIYLRNLSYKRLRNKWKKKIAEHLSESQEDKAAKKQKFDEEVEELRKHIQIVPNDEDDVYTEATPLATKVPVVDYEIYTENNKPYYKIIRADESPQLFLSFLSLLRNFNREDLEVLWELVKERFAYSKPKNFLDDFLLTTLTYMFEKPDVQAQVWKNQRTVHGLA